MSIRVADGEHKYTSVVPFAFTDTVTGTVGRIQVAYSDQGTEIGFASDGSSYTTFATTRTTLRGTGPNYFTLGRQPAVSPVSTAGIIGEVIVVVGVITSDEKAKLEGYLAWKWGLEGDLPIGHTYKSAAPTV